MRIKTMIIVIITILLTVVLMQNTNPVTFTILFTDVRMSKLLALVIVAAIGFILGYLVGRPKSVRKIGGEFAEDENINDDTDTLSDEDRDYISHP